jgi:hypothetical protein
MPEEIRARMGMDAMTPEAREAAWPTPAAPVVVSPVAENADDKATKPVGAAEEREPA